MATENVIPFLRTVASRPDILDDLKVRSRNEVIVAAGELGYPFSEAEFNALIWGLEERFAAARNETFDHTFPLWETMWGVYFLEYLVDDLIPGLEAVGLVPRGA